MTTLIQTIHGADSVADDGTNWTSFIPARLTEAQREDWAYTLRRDVRIADTVTIDATGVTFAITVGGVTDTAIAFNATAAAFEAAIVALAGVTAGDVTVTGGPGDSGGTTPYTLTWERTGLLYGTNTPVVTVDGTNLTGGGATATIVAVTSGN